MRTDIHHLHSPPHQHIPQAYITYWEDYRQLITSPVTRSNAFHSTPTPEQLRTQALILLKRNGKVFGITSKRIKNRLS